MPMRITGLATGLDMDEIIKTTMQPYRIKVDQTKQKKEILEIKQKLYQSVLDDGKEFFNKYFDVAKSGNLLSSNSWTTIKFDSSNESAVSVSATSTAKMGNYTISGSAAKAAKATITENIVDGEKIVINGKEFTLSGSNERDIASNLNSELAKAGINVSVRYSNLAGSETENKNGLIFESTILGKESTFTIGGSTTSVGTSLKGVDGKAAIIEGFTIDDLKAAGKINIGGKEISLDIDDTNRDNDEYIISKLNSALEEFKFKASKDDSGAITLTSNVEGASVQDINLSIDGVNSISFTQGVDATNSTVTLNKDDLKDKSSIVIGGNTLNLDFSNVEAGKEAEYLNNLLQRNNIGITASLDSATGEITFTSKAKGESSEFSVQTLSADAKVASGGQDSNIVIKDDKGGVYTHKSNSNTVTLDGVTFKFNGEITDDVKISAKKDVTEVKDKLINFVNDYNKYIEKLNGLINAKQDKSFQPLTDDQKKEMSEDEIKLWNEKVEKGQLSRDSDISRIVNSLKSAMTSSVKGMGLTLEKIGITPVKDYKDKNGMLVIDEDKLAKALEEDSEAIMNLFTKRPPTDENLSAIEKNSQTGILYRMKTVLEDEITSISKSAIYKKSAAKGSAFFTSTLAKGIQDYERKIEDMEKDIKVREQRLYSQYARLETVMNNYNSQQSYLTSYLGTN